MKYNRSKETNKNINPILIIKQRWIDKSEKKHKRKYDRINKIHYNRKIVHDKNKRKKGYLNLFCVFHEPSYISPRMYAIKLLKFVKHGSYNTEM